MFRRMILLTTVVLVLAASALPAHACAALIGRNGSVNLLRTSTLAAYYKGFEHYITSFSFQGGGGEFGSIIPLPGIPSKVERGGNWTLQRLVRETQPRPEAAEDGIRKQAFAASARVILETRIDALDITVLEGGAFSVGQWAREHGFLLSPDTPEVLDFYAKRSPIFMAARFDAEAAKGRGQEIGDGTPIHLTIPTNNPWVPLRILGLGKAPSEIVNADVYLLTDKKPALLPEPGRGMDRRFDAPASRSLLADLRSDKGMEWIPADGMWLTYLAIDSQAGELTYDLAVDASGKGSPSRVLAGLEDIATRAASESRLPVIALGLSMLFGLAAAAIWLTASKDG